jgi:small GTP-binding protein
MAEMNETPSGVRTHIAFFGLRNAGKSTLVNALTGQETAIVSDVAGTTTDPVSKAMEILPLGPCLITDTAGLDDEGPLGEERVRRSLEVLEKADVAVWVTAGRDAGGEEERRFEAACRARGVPTLKYRRGDPVDGLKAKIAGVKLADAPRPLVADLVAPGDVVVCVCPIDESAPKGRLILPQQQVVRELLDAGCAAVVCQPRQLSSVLSRCGGVRFVITDSQAFGEVARAVPPNVPLTSFSIVFARAKGDLAAYCAGAEAMRRLKEGDLVLIAEGCTHHRQCSDIGSVKLPKWLQAHASCGLRFEFASGSFFPDDLSRFALVVQCGGCMLTRRAVQARIACCREAGVPIVNYGIAIAACHGIHASPDTCMVVRRVPDLRNTAGL